MALERRRIKTGDSILRINSRDIANISDFDAAMNEVQTGKVVRMLILRGGSRRALYVRTGAAL